MCRHRGGPADPPRGATHEQSFRLPPHPFDLPRFEPPGRYVTRGFTVRTLVTHRSGLTRDDEIWSATELSREKVLERCAGLHRHDLYGEVEIRLERVGDVP